MESPITSDLHHGNAQNINTHKKQRYQRDSDLQNQRRDIDPVIFEHIDDQQDGDTIQVEVGPQPRSNIPDSTAHELSQRLSSPWQNGQSNSRETSFQSIVPSPRAHPIQSRVEEESPKPFLRFIVAKGWDALNFDRPISASEFLSDTVETFFDRVISRRRNQQTAKSITSLTLKQRWGNPGELESFVVNRDADNHQWEDLKNAIKQNFEFASDTMSRKKFEVWVSSDIDQRNQ